MLTQENRSVNSASASIYEETRYLLVLRMCLLFTVLISLVSVLSFVKAKYNPIPDLIAVGLCLFSYFLLIKTKRYRWVGGFASLSSFIVIVANLFAVEAIHYTTPLWMVVNVLFTFMVLERVFGILSLIANFSCLFLFLYFQFPRNLEELPSFDHFDAMLYIAEFVILAIALGYVLFTFVSATQRSEERMMDANAILTDQNKIISRQKAEMEVMLKEIHHRVKNNLQIISSLLRLQADTLTQAEREVYDEAVNRVSAMAIIHEKMYQSDSLAEFDLREYIISLVDSLFENYSVSGTIASDVQVHVGQLTTKSVVPVAMLLNELVSNSVKHAFKNCANPKVVIILADIGQGQFMIEYSDNGTWVENHTDSFGLEVIDAMTQQLDGTKVRRSGENGTFYIFQLHNIA